MPSLGPAEILVILVVALLVLGPNKMPEVGRQLARGVRELRRIQQHINQEIQGVVSEFDVTSPSENGSTNGSTPGGDPVPKLPPKDTAGTATEPDATPDPEPPPEGPTPPGPSPA
ncbi:MAG TPA: twin-arginine translocase TatA/TatE family subunit [Acidimicrobiia bacterium]|nr:twin-arginine translocase TatA/TatE family subunit [Acidimicrobiia bacterium]